MAYPNPSGPPGTPGLDQQSQKLSYLERRREKIRAEIERNRRGEYTVPTWVLALALAAIVGGWLALVFLT